MKKYLEVRADTNDGDYITERSEITDEELEQILPIVEAIKEFDRNHQKGRGDYNWLCGEIRGAHEKGPHEVYRDILTPEQIELFNEYTPYGEYGIHTIDSVKILHVEKEETLL